MRPHAVERLGVGQRAPAGRSAIALREKRAVGRCVRPVLEPIGDPLGIRAERLRRLQVDDRRPAPWRTSSRLARDVDRPDSRGAAASPWIRYEAAPTALGAASVQLAERRPFAAPAARAAAPASSAAPSSRWNARHAVVDLLQADAVGVEHRAAAPGREAVAGQVDDVDVGGAQREALLEDARAFVDQRVDRRARGSPRW